MVSRLRPRLFALLSTSSPSTRRRHERGRLVNGERARRPFSGTAGGAGKEGGAASRDSMAASTLCAAGGASRCVDAATTGLGQLAARRRASRARRISRACAMASAASFQLRPRGCSESAGARGGRPRGAWCAGSGREGRARGRPPAPGAAAQRALASWGRASLLLLTRLQKLRIADAACGAITGAFTVQFVA